MVQTAVRWRDVEPLAQDIFRVWSDGGDLEWARTAWCILGEAGLTPVVDDEDMAEVLGVRFRLLILGVFFHTFAKTAWNEGYVDPEMWIQERGFSSRPDDLRYLNEPLYDDLAASAAADEDRFPWSTFIEIIVADGFYQEYDLVVKTLREAYGGDNDLFVSLWVTPTKLGPGWRQFPEELRDEVLNQLEYGDGKLPAWNWLTSGASYKG